MKLHCLSPYKDKFDNLFPCGKCTPCRIRRVSEWQLRLQFEANSWKHVAFVTLTYSDEFLPRNPFTFEPTLDKKELQLFWKRLRKRLKRKIKYFACGEYGSLNSRPHYHAIIYGLDALNDSDRQAVIDSWPYCESFMFDWKKKHNAIDVANEHCMRYVAGYVQKKLFGKDAEVYKIKGVIPPFQCASQGLGLQDFLLPKNELNCLVMCPLTALQDQFRDTFVRSAELKCPRIILNQLKFLNKDSTKEMLNELSLNAAPLIIGPNGIESYSFEPLEQEQLTKNIKCFTTHKEN